MMQASAPGKVLILGGYLIVESPNVGISIGVSARFTTRVVRGGSVSSPASTTTVHVSSPQFNQNFIFCCHTSDGTVRVAQTAGPASPFLSHAVLYAVAAARLSGDAVEGELFIELLADNDFYSQRNYLEAQGRQVTVANLRELPPHLPLVGDISKTGLGSSAAMTTSVVACLYSHFHGAQPDTELLHRVSQVAHCLAQGKIGSGFDVYTAVYGTCAYRRFPAEPVEHLVRGSGDSSTVVLATLSQCVSVDRQWVSHIPFHLPPGIVLVLGDIHMGGSSTPGMVAKVMAWRQSVASDQDSLWEQLRRNNEAYLASLHHLLDQAERQPSEHASALAALSNVRIQEHVPATTEERRFVDAARLADRSRAYLRDVGKAAGVKVEPEELTALLDATAALAGVFAVGCPGAGGYDAVFALVIGDDNSTAVEQLWEKYTGLHVCPLLAREDPGGLLIGPLVD